MSDLQRNYITEPDTFRRMEVITGVARRRRWPRSEKARIVAESYAPGASATAVAVRHGLHRNQIFAWRRQLRNRAALVGQAAGVCPGHAGVCDRVWLGRCRPGRSDRGHCRRDHDPAGHWV